jgi:hypothetical protein
VGSAVIDALNPSFREQARSYNRFISLERSCPRRMEWGMNQRFHGKPLAFVDLPAPTDSIIQGETP